MNVLAINGSHRPGKNTATMLNYVLEEIRPHGVSTELVELSGYSIKLCKSCNKCLTQPLCTIQDDDMAAIAEKMMAADAIILGSPVYFCNVSSMFKVFSDRTRWMLKYKALLDGKIGGVLTHAGLRNGGQEFTQLVLERFIQAHGMRMIDARDPEKGILNLGPMGTMFDDVDGNELSWKKDVSYDHLTVQMCRSLGRNILKALE